MYKGELEKAIAKKTGATQQVVNTILKAFEEVVIETVASGEKVQLKGFVTFQTRERAERNGRHPQTGESIVIPALTLPKATFGTRFKEAVR